MGLAIIAAISVAKTNIVKISGATDMDGTGLLFQTAFFAAAVICAITLIIAAFSIKTLK